MAIHVDPAALDVSWLVACLPYLQNASGHEFAEAARQAAAQIHGTSLCTGNDDAIVSFLMRQTRDTVRSIVISCRTLRNRELTLSDILEVVEQCAISYSA
jgi:hypothetical protein